jgi:RecJ-like exonuclease
MNKNKEFESNISKNKNKRNDNKNDKHSKNNKNRNNRRNNNFKGGHRGPRGNKVDNFGEAKAGDYFEGVVKILRKAVPGPVVFNVSDGYLQVDAVAKESEFEANQTVKLRGKVSDRGGKLQIEIDTMDEVEQDFDKVLERMSQPVDRPLSIKSKRLETMKPKMLEIAKRIRRAVIDGEAIIIRHHSDTDGISSGLALEHAIKMLMEKVGVNPQYNLYRSVSKPPFYDISDMLHDVSLAKRIVNNFGQKKPLFIITDNGSTPEDAFSHKTLHDLGYEVIVIDHHNPIDMVDDHTTSVCKYLSNHLNPYMFGLDSQTCAGMLCYEVARLIDKEYEEPLIPAVSGIADRSDIQETEDYIAATGKDKKYLGDVGMAIDFTSYNMRYSSGEGLYEEIYSNPTMVEMMASKVNEGMETQLQSTMPYVKTQEINNVIFSHIALEKYTVRFKYPTAGKVIGMIHDTIAEEKPKHAVLSIGYLSDMLIIRATKPILPVGTIIKKLQEKYPHANVDGGGHECAGAIKFVSAHQELMIEEVKNMLKELTPYEEDKEDDY